MSIKRLSPLLIAALLAAALTACAKPPAPSGGSESASFEEEPSLSAFAPAEIPEPPPPYLNPLTGEGSYVDLAQSRPIAIMLNNLKKALPQLGVSSADIIYEIPAEGGITRMLAVFQSMDEVGEIGTVRSARDYYAALALGHDAIFLHAGGSPQAYTAMASWGVAALDCVNGPYEGTLFWRDAARRKSAGLEHSVLTSGEKITELLPTYSRLRLTHSEGYSYPLTFLGDGETATGTAAQVVSIQYSTYKTGVFTYDSDLGRYRVEEYGAPYLDGNTGQQVSVKNVLILHTDISPVRGDTEGRLSVRTTGTGKGQLFCDGVQQELLWSRPDNASPFTYTTPDGQPIKLGVGATYVNIIGSDAVVTGQ